jgi:predicted acyl esterase
MWGGSYPGYDQWATASLRPPHLKTIVPHERGKRGAAG